MFFLFGYEPRTGHNLQAVDFDFQEATHAHKKNTHILFEKRYCNL